MYQAEMIEDEMYWVTSISKVAGVHAHFVDPYRLLESRDTHADISTEYSWCASSPNFEGQH